MEKWGVIWGKYLFTYFGYVVLWAIFRLFNMMKHGVFTGRFTVFRHGNMGGVAGSGHDTVSDVREK